MTPEQIEEMKRESGKPLSAMERLMLHVEWGHEAPDLTDVYEESQALTAEIDRLRAKVEKADVLAEVVDLPDQSDTETERYHYHWSKIDDALTAYREAGQ